MHERSEAVNPTSVGRGIIKAEAVVTSKKSSLHFKSSDAIREKDNQMIREAGKAVLDVGILEAATIWGFNEIAEGFSQANMARIVAGAGVFGGTAYLAIPRFWHHLQETRLSRKEKNAISKKFPEAPSV